MLKLKKVFLDDLNNLPSDTEFIKITKLSFEDIDDDDEEYILRIKSINLPIFLKYLFIRNIDPDLVYDDTKYYLNLFIDNIKLPFGCQLMFKKCFRELEFNVEIDLETHISEGDYIYTNNILSRHPKMRYDLLLNKDATDEELKRTYRKAIKEFNKLQDSLFKPK